MESANYTPAFPSPPPFHFRGVGAKGPKSRARKSYKFFVFVYRHLCFSNLYCESIDAVSRLSPCDHDMFEFVDEGVIGFLDVLLSSGDISRCSSDILQVTEACVEVDEGPDTFVTH